jgi:hypothetical protein
VDQIVLFIGIKRIGAGEIVERAEHLIEVPWIFKLDLPGPHFGLRRNAADVLLKFLTRVESRC